MSVRAKLMRFLWLLVFAAVVGAGAGAGAGAARADDGFLDPTRAFPLSVERVDAQRLALRFDVPPGYYLYRDKFAVTAPGLALGALDVPRGQVQHDATFDKDLETLRGTVTLVLGVPPAPAGTRVALTVGHQGCADRGLCYPPQQRTVALTLGPDGLVDAALADTPPPAGPPAAGGGLLDALTGRSGADAAPPADRPANPVAPADPARAPTDPAAVSPAAVQPATASAGTAAAAPLSSAEGAVFDTALRTRHLPTIAGVFLLAGVLLSLTPCVLPMVPILSSIIVGQPGRVSRWRGFTLAAAYALGMAVVYTAFGVVAALLGEGLGAALQNPWVLGAFALLLVGMSLSMFGVYTLQVPAAVQSRLSTVSHRLPGGRHAGVFVMGGVSALIVGPCFAAPLAGALVYISQTRDALTGAVALFSMAVGMSVPLLLVGVSAGTLLPRSGEWMHHVKHFFGVLLLAVALWMVTPVLPAWLTMVAAAVLLLVCGVQFGAFEPLAHAAHHPGRTAAKGVGLAMAVLAAVLLVGVASGGRSVLQPLQHLTAGAGTRGPATAALRFTPVVDLAALDAAVAAATRPVMLDVYADWCVSCKEFEAFTLTDPAVQARLARMDLLRVDVTANSAADQALLRRHGLFGPPAMLFFPPSGAELPGLRVIGFQSAERFLAHLDQVEPLTRAP